jgi:MinD-like ATPase involved in chromosome partitioning or flagellar assembly
VSEPTIALVFTADAWVEELHRHCTDHGGARVRQVLIEPALALEEQYDVLVVSHRWPSLTHGFVDDVHHRGRSVLGVYSRDEPTGREWLAAVGADATVASDNGPGGIVAALRALHDEQSGGGGRRREEPAVVARPAPITLVSGPPGGGATEVAIALGLALPEALVVDADDVAPSVAPRLGIAIEPNLRTALDAIEYGGASLDDHLVTLDGFGVRVLAGLPSAATWPQVRPADVLRLVERAGELAAHVVVDAAAALEDLPISMARPRHAVTRALVMEADAIVAVGAASPVNVTRLVAWLGAARELAPRTPIHAVVNRAPKHAFARGELVDEVGRAFGVASVTVVPHDRRVEQAAWDGGIVTRGPFVRAIARVAAARLSVVADVDEAAEELRAAS